MNLRTFAVGLDAALVSAALGFMYALLTSAPVGAVALPLAMMATLVGFVVGGLVQATSWRGMLVVATPNATGVLVLAALLTELQALPGARGSVAMAMVAIAGIGLAAGALQLLFGALRIGSAMKFLPFPVVAGFTNTIAASLIVSMMPSALGHSGMGRLLQAGNWWHDVHPGAVLVAVAGTGAGILTRRRWPRAPATVAALGVASAVHGVLALTGAGAWLGPTLPLGAQTLPDWPDASALLAAASSGWALWGQVLGAALTLAVLNSLFSLLAASAMQSPADPPLDSSRLLLSLGLGNVASALCGGLPASVVTPTSVVVRRTAVPRGPVLLIHAAVLMLIFLPGHAVLRHLPLAAVAAAVFTAASAMFDPWSLQTLRKLLTRQHLPARASMHVAVAFSVALIGLTAGLAAALTVGTLSAVVLLAIELRRSVVVHVDDGVHRRSRRVRPAADAQRLDALGTQLRVIELGHWLYFGTVDEISAVLERQGPELRWLVLDLRRVAGVEGTAARALAMAAQRLAARGTQVILAGIPEGDERRSAFTLFAGPALRLVADLDLAIEQAENALLGHDIDEPTVLDPEALPVPGLTRDEQRSLQRYMSRVDVRPRQRLFSVDDPGDALYFVLLGRFTLWVPQRGAAPLRLLSFGAGMLFGEMALLDGHRRSSEAIADTAGRVAVLTRPVFDALALTEPALHAAITRGLMQQLVARLRETTRLLHERG